MISRNLASCPGFLSGWYCTDSLRKADLISRSLASGCRLSRSYRSTSSSSSSCGSSSYPPPPPPPKPPKPPPPMRSSRLMPWPPPCWNWKNWATLPRGRSSASSRSSMWRSPHGQEVQCACARPTRGEPRQGGVVASGSLHRSLLGLRAGGATYNSTDDRHPSQPYLYLTTVCVLLAVRTLHTRHQFRHGDPHWSSQKVFAQIRRCVSAALANATEHAACAPPSERAAGAGAHRARPSAPYHPFVNYRAANGPPSAWCRGSATGG